MDQLPYAQTESFCSMGFAVPLPEDTFVDSPQRSPEPYVDLLPPVSSVPPVVMSVLDTLGKDQSCWRMPGGAATQPVDGLGTPSHLVSVPAGCMDLFWSQGFIQAKEVLAMSTARNFRYIGGNGCRGTSDIDKVWPTASTRAQAR